jgi:thioredoxin reductase
MLTTDVAIVGAGPAGLFAAVEAAKAGAKTTLINEYVEPGGQLTKQIHKFFGSKEHEAAVRGIDIAAKLFGEIDELGVEKRMGTVVWSIFHSNILAIAHDGKSEMLRANKIILATGASENAFAFPGWTLPGVMGAGAAQTLINLQRVARAGVPIWTSHTVEKAHGQEAVEGATMVKVDKRWRPVPGTEREVEVDTICIAVGLTPLTELAWLANCNFTYVGSLGGYVPLYDEKMETTVKGLYVAGDAAGIEEASTAMEEGRVAAISAVESLGYMTQQRACALRTAAYERLKSFRIGPFGEMRDQGKRFIWRERQKYEEGV